MQGPTRGRRKGVMYYPGDRNIHDSNPQLQAGKLGKEAGVKKRKLIQIINGEKEDKPHNPYDDFDDDIPF